MNMIGLEGRGLIIAISVSLLLVGAVVYYFNTRVASLEKALVRQNQVLADFIQNVKTSHIQEKNMQVVDHSSAANGVVANGATQLAVDAAIDYFNTGVPQEKVDVSDDEEDGSSSEEDESELESELDDSNEDVIEEYDSGLSGNINVKVEPLMSQDSAVIGAMLVDMPGMYPVESLNVTDGPTVVELLDNDEKGKSDNLTPVEYEQETTDVKKIIKLSEVDDLDAVSSSLGSSHGDEEEEDDGETIDSKQENAITDFSKLKVAKLKELASKKSIKNATKMKKAALIASLEAKK